MGQLYCSEQYSNILCSADRHWLALQRSLLVAAVLQNKTKTFNSFENAG